MVGHEGEAAGGGRRAEGGALKATMLHPPIRDSPLDLLVSRCKARHGKRCLLSLAIRLAVAHHLQQRYQAMRMEDRVLVLAILENIQHNLCCMRHVAHFMLHATWYSRTAEAPHRQR